MGTSRIGFWDAFYDVYIRCGKSKNKVLACHAKLELLSENPERRILLQSLVLCRQH